MGNITKGTGVVGNRNYIGRLKYAEAKYDFAVDGGAISTITPVQTDLVPSGARVLDAFLIVDTLLTSSGAATVSIGLEGAADLRAANVFGTAPALDTTGSKRFALVTATTTPLVVTTADRPITFTVASFALTAGVIRVVVAYVEVAA